MEGSQKKTGKRTGKDQAHQKLTYPAVLGLEPSREIARQLGDDAIRSLSGFGSEAAPLRAIAEFILERKS